MGPRGLGGNYWFDVIEMRFSLCHAWSVVESLQLFHFLLLTPLDVNSDILAEC